jgi:hypothetical protein
MGILWIRLCWKRNSILCKCSQGAFIQYDNIFINSCLADSFRKKSNEIIFNALKARKTYPARGNAPGLWNLFHSALKGRNIIGAVASENM